MDLPRLPQLCRTLTRLMALLALISNPAPAAENRPVPADQARNERFFEQEIRPLLVTHCDSCHGKSKAKGGLRLDSMESILQGGESGPAIVPGKPEQSLIVEAINYHGLEMPPTGKLASRQIQAISDWITKGAPWPGYERAGQDAAKLPAERSRAKFKDDDRALWSIQPIRSPGVPPPQQGEPAWSRGPIDAFLLARLREHGLTPAAETDKATLIRRLTFDLTGLPPTPEEMDTFQTDRSPDAYERLVDRLLASPRYGQHWARHWLDLVRFAESDGHRQDAFRAGAWRYRDYVLHAFNVDKPYDRFLTEQLAGDELDPHDPEMKIAVGYLRLGPYEYNQRNVHGQWADILNDITDVTGETFLGLSIACARCHDHKFDPILQRDYYRLQAFFTPLIFRDDAPVAPIGNALIASQKPRNETPRVTELRRQIAAIEKPYRDKGTQSALAKFPDDIKAILNKPDSERSAYERQIGALAYRQIQYEHDQIPAILKANDKPRWSELKQALSRLSGADPNPAEGVLTATDVGPSAPATIIPGDRSRQAIEPGVLSILYSKPMPISRLSSSPETTGRRLALAQWLTRPDNPLPARVMVNRVWQYHFGRGLVGTASDFGRLGEAPSHPDLLDWLASEFMRNGWRLKPLHRQVVLSAAYRQASTRTSAEAEQARRIDPENRLLWHWSTRRLAAEEIRDAMLAASGELDPIVAGPSVPTVKPRRAIAVRLVRNASDPLLNIFDGPDGSVTIARRYTSTTAPQALLMLNGDWVMARAQAMADQILKLVPDSERGAEAVALAYRRALGRPPTNDELNEARAFAVRQSQADSGPRPLRSLPFDRSTFVDFCHVLLNSNEFFYVD